MFRDTFTALQFHPEVTHTLQGEEIMRRFVRDICGCPGDWTAGNIVSDAIDNVREQVGEGKVLLGLSGGVDSSVVAALLHEAIGDQLVCVFVDHRSDAPQRRRPGHGDVCRTHEHQCDSSERRRPVLQRT